MPALHPDSPPDTAATSRRTDDLVLRRLENVGMLLLRSRTQEDSFLADVRRRLGVDLPLRPNTSVRSDLSVLWLGPNRWLLVSDRGPIQHLQKTLRADLSAYPCIVADVGDSRVAIEIAGTAARTLLARVCSLDLDAGRFEPGACAQSLLVRIPLLLHRIGDDATFHGYVDRSLAHYAWDWLSDAAEEFGGPVSP